MKKLPEKFCIKCDPSHSLWEKYVNWLNKEYKPTGFLGSMTLYGTSVGKYYGCTGSNELKTMFNINPNKCTVITLEEWDEIVNGFVLPEKWRVKDCKEAVDYVKNNLNLNVAPYREGCEDRYLCIDTNKKGFESYHFYSEQLDSLNDYTEITLEQFKKYVLKEYFEDGVHVVWTTDMFNQPVKLEVEYDPALDYPSEFERPTPYRLSKEQSEKINESFIEAWCKKLNERVGFEWATRVYTIEDLSNGKVAVINDGNIDELSTVLKAAFPNDVDVLGRRYWKYYNQIKEYPHLWGRYATTDLPTQSVKEFIKQLKTDMKTIKDVSELKVGDEILIEKKPSFWSSYLNFNNPLKGVLIFPHKLTIKEMKSDEQCHSMTCGEYGWSLQPIIDAGCKLISRNNKTQNMEDKRFPFKLTVNQAQSIIDIACTRWKETLAELWAKQMLVDKTVIVPEKFYVEMREACTPEQNKLFDDIFGKDEEQFSVGDWIYCLGHGGNAANHPEFDYDNHFKPGSVQKVIRLDTCEGGHSLAVGHLGGVARVGVFPNYFRKATPEEIEKAQCPYEDGELCWVKDKEMWYLRYATGRVSKGCPTFYSNQEKTGYENTFKHHKSAKGVELPKD